MSRFVTPGDGLIPVHSQRSLRIVSCVIVAVALTFGSSCYVIRHEYDGGKQITPGTLLSRPSEFVDKIEGTKWVPYCLFGWICLADSSGPRFAEELANARVGYTNYDGITRTHIEDYENALGVVLRILTLGLFGIYSVSVTGDVERLAGQ